MFVIKYLSYTTNYLFNSRIKYVYLDDREFYCDIVTDSTYTNIVNTTHIFDIEINYSTIMS